MPKEGKSSKSVKHMAMDITDSEEEPDYLVYTISELTSQRHHSDC